MTTEPLSDYAHFKALPAEERDALGFKQWQWQNHAGGHGPGCWAWGPTHWQCAVQEIARLESRVQEVGKAARENRSRAVLALESEVQRLRNANMPAKCWCATCRPITLQDMRMVLCPTCGNKRCPRATSHENACTGSNEPGQKGSSYEHVRPTSGPVP